MTAILVAFPACADDVGTLFANPSTTQAPLTNRVAAAVPGHGEISYGDPSAKVVVVEYASLTCSHCAAFHADVWPRLKQKYVDSGKVRWIVRDIPGIDPLSISETMLLNCVGQTRQKAAMDALLARQQEIMKASKPFETVAEILENFGLEKTSGDNCMHDKKLYDSLVAERERATTVYGVTGTPTFFLDNDKIKGARTFEEMDATISAALAK